MTVTTKPKPLSTLYTLFGIDPATTPTILPPLDDEDLTEEELAEREAQDEYMSALYREIEAEIAERDRYTYVHEDDEETIAAERRADRMSYCGTYGQRPTLITKEFYSVRYRCGCWRDGCPICMEDRKAEIRAQLWRALKILGNTLTVICLPRKEATKFVRRLRLLAELYKRYPTEEGDYLVFDGEQTGHLYSPEEAIDLDTLSLSTLSSTPRGRRISGKLGNHPTPEHDPDSTLILFQQVFSDLEWNEQEEAAKEAAKRTEAEPEGVGGLQEAVDELLQNLKDVILERGGKIIHVQDLKKWVSNKSYIDW